MKSLLLEFAETPSKQEQDWSLIEYSQDQNLSVLSGSRTPAVKYLDASTSTFTKANGEGSDADKDLISLYPLMATTTYSANNQEPTDSDKIMQNLLNMLATKTVTESVEASDSDK